MKKIDNKCEKCKINSVDNPYKFNVVVEGEPFVYCTVCSGEYAKEIESWKRYKLSPEQAERLTISEQKTYLTRRTQE